MPRFKVEIREITDKHYIVDAPDKDAAYDLVHNTDVVEPNQEFPETETIDITEI